MKKHTTLFSSVFFTVLFLAASTAYAQREVDSVGEPANFNCSSGTQTHMDKIIFAITAPLINVTPIGQPETLKNYPLKTELDIKVLDNPNNVADLKGKVLSFLGATYLLSAPQGVLDPKLVKVAVVNRSRIKILGVDYSVICSANVG